MKPGLLFLLLITGSHLYANFSQAHWRWRKDRPGGRPWRWTRRRT